jgi:putative CocE/NonD family hydrolase
MNDRHWDSASAPLPVGWERVRARRSAHYLTMRDGVRIAVELFLPAGAAGRVPTIVRQTRYLRALEARVPGPLAQITRAFDLYDRTRRVFLAAGYAWLDVDVRGSGASTGTQPYPWSMPEILDGGEIARWIVEQPWSSGKIGSLGISYDGTCADLLLLNAHPGVVAVAPMFSLFDAYADVAFPGGVHLAWFTEVWAAYNRALDAGGFADAFAPVVRFMARAAANSPAPRGPDRLLAALGGLDDDRFRAVIGGVLRRAVAGVVPVGGDRAELARAIADHGRNVSVHEGAKRIVFRDDRGISSAAPDDSIDALSPFTYSDRLRASGAAVYSYSGWRDGGYPRSAIDRHATLGGERARLLVGPWVHTGKLRIRPFDVATPTSFDHDAELLAFFDEHTRDKPRAGDGAPVRYYTLVEERWKTAAAFPPPFEPRVSYLAPKGRLSAIAMEDDAGEDAHRVDPALGTGERSRWRSLISLVPGDYPDRRERDRRLLTYDSQPLARPLEVTGFPVAVLFVSWDDDDDGRVFAYLEDVAPDGRVAYVTEGQLRAIHRRTSSPRAAGERPARSFRRADAQPVAPGEVAEIALEMQPISWLFERGHRVRLAIAGGDADHFAPAKATTMRVRWGRDFPSRIELPIPK